MLHPKHFYKPKFVSHLGRAICQGRFFISTETEMMSYEGCAWGCRWLQVCPVPPMVSNGVYLRHVVRNTICTSGDRTKQTLTPPPPRFCLLCFNLGLLENIDVFLMYQIYFDIKILYFSLALNIPAVCFICSGAIQ